MKAPQLFVCWFALLAGAGAKELRVAGIFGDRMVLQRETDAPIWGWGEAGAKVTVSPSWQKATVETTADDGGRWKASLPTPKAGGPFTITVQSGGAKVALKDVLIGEVWVCSGQSNMQWKLRGFGVDHWSEELKKANRPQLRYINIPQAIAFAPQQDMKAPWVTSTPRNVLPLSAVAYFFAARLQEELDVPVGIISTSWGGSSAETWISESVLREKFPEFSETFATYPDAKKVSGPLSRAEKNMPEGIQQRSPSVTSNTMIEPLIPYAIRGVTWYQGESNVSKPLQYRRLFPALIEDWRTRWGRTAEELPFYYVQIAPFHYRTEPMPVALLREAQLQTLGVPNTGMVVTMDVGAADNIHPKPKKPVGERLARLALARTYGKAIVDSGPMYQKHLADGATMKLTFTEIGSGLKSLDGEALRHFTAAGADKVFHPAKAVIKDDQVWVRSDKVAKPVAVRFGWGNADLTNLGNAEGLPASSFRTDEWPIAKREPAPRKPAPKKVPAKS